MPAADARAIDLAGGRLRLRLRPETAADEAFRFALFCAARPPGEDFSPLGPEMAQRMLRHQFLAQNHSYRKDFPDARFEIVTLDDAPVGYVIVHIGTAEARIVDLAILPGRRSAGLGEAVVRGAAAEAAARALPLRASVLKGNAGALRFCRRIGFAPIGEIAPFYIALEWRGA